MLIILSDLHFSDGSTSSNVVKEVFSQVLFPEILLRANSDQRKIEEVHLVLSGDIFDIVRTDKWLKIEEAKRPWNGALDPQYGLIMNLR